MLGDDPPYLSVGTEVSAKYKGAFCEAKIRKVVRSVKCRVTYKQGLGTATVTDDQIKGTLRVGASVEARHNDKKDFVEATITKIQDCSQYTVVFDDGDITTLRRTALCLKSGRHFAESETLDQLPLTHPEHFGNPVIGGRRGRRSRQTQDDSSDDEDDRGNDSGSGSGGKEGPETEPEIGRVVCVELGDKKKKDNWFPGLVVAPTAQDTVRIRVRDDYLVRSFKDARYYTVPKKEATEFTKDLVNKIENSALKIAVEKALLFLEKNELPPHWDRDSLFGNSVSSGNSDTDGELDSDSSDDEPREEKDHFVAQLYKFMDDRGTPINNCPMIGNEDIDLYRLFRAVYKLGGYNRVTNQNQWKLITRRLSFSMQNNSATHNLVKQAYKKFLHSFEDFYRKLGCTMVNHPRGSMRKQRPGRSLIRDKDRNTPVPIQDKSLTKSEKDEDEKDNKKGNIVTDEDTKKEKRDIKKEPMIKDEETQPKVKRKEEPAEESASGQESDVNIDGEEESSSSEKSQKSSARLTPSSVTGKSKTTNAPSVKNKEEAPKKKTVAEKKKIETKRQDKKDEKIKEDDSTKTRSKAKEDTAKSSKANITSDNRETRTPSRDPDKKNISKQRRMTDDELKKRGRKKKDVENEKGKSTEERSVEYAPCYKGLVEVGDRLKVYYGPTHESKVTYEAKVIDKEHEGVDAMYLVHYTGWNTRYDEWIKSSRIAHNFTQAQGRVKRVKTTPRPQTPSSNSSNKSSKTVTTPSTSSTVTSSTSGAQSRRRAQSDAPGGAGSSKDSRKEDRESTSATRSMTPSPLISSGLRTKSPATTASNRLTRVTRNTDSASNELGRRTRRGSGHADTITAEESESEDTDSLDSDASEPETLQIQSRTRIKGGVQEKNRREARRRAESRMKIEETSDGEIEKDIEEPRRGRRLRKTIGKLQEVKSEPESDDEQPKGRDFDLNQIRSELKGFDKAVKLEITSVEPEPEEEKGELPSTQIKEEKSETEIIPEKKVSLEPEKKREVSKIEQPNVVPIKRESIKIEDTPSESTDDIYEFKEPEPFEFEVRNKRDSGGSTSSVEKEKEKDKEKDKMKKRVFDDDIKSPKKRQKTFGTPTTPVQSKPEQKQDSSPTESVDPKKKPRKIFKKNDGTDEVDTEGEDVTPSVRDQVSKFYPANCGVTVFKRKGAFSNLSRAMDDGAANDAITADASGESQKKKQTKTLSSATPVKSNEIKPETTIVDTADKKKVRKVFNKAEESEETEELNKEPNKFLPNYAGAKATLRKDTYSNKSTIENVEGDENSLTDGKEKAKKTTDEDASKTMKKKQKSFGNPVTKSETNSTDAVDAKKKTVRRVTSKKSGEPEGSDESGTDETEEPTTTRDHTKYFSHYSGPKAKAAAAMINDNETSQERLNTPKLDNQVSEFSKSANASISRNKDDTKNKITDSTTAPADIKSTNLDKKRVPDSVVSGKSETKQEMKPLDFTPIIPHTLPVPAPISARLPATASIEEKLSAAAVFRSKLKDIKKDEDLDNVPRKTLKDTTKKVETTFAKKVKEKEKEEKAKHEPEKKKQIIENPIIKKDPLQEIEIRRDPLLEMIKKKEEEVLKTTTTTVTTPIITKTYGNLKKEPTMKLEDTWKKAPPSIPSVSTVEVSNEITNNDLSKDFVRKETIVSKIKSTIDRDSVDSTDSSDSERRLTIIDSEEFPDDKYNESTSEIKTKSTSSSTSGQFSSIIRQEQPNIITKQSELTPSIGTAAIINAITQVKSSRVEEDGENLNSLLCEEEIPGSPTPGLESIDHEHRSSSTQNLTKTDLATGSKMAVAFVAAQMPLSTLPSSTHLTKCSLVTTMSSNITASQSTSSIVAVSMATQHASVQSVHQTLTQSQVQPQVQQQIQPQVQSQIQSQQQQPKQQPQQQPQQQHQQPQPLPQLQVQSSSQVQPQPLPQLQVQSSSQVQPHQQQLHPPQPLPPHQHNEQAPPPIAVAVQRRQSNEAAPVMDNTPPTTPDSLLSNVSGSPRDEGTGGSTPSSSEDNSKLNRDSSEAENESAGKGSGPGFSEDDGSSLVNSELGGNGGATSSSSDRIPKPPAKRSTVVDNENISPKKRKKRKDQDNNPAFGQNSASGKKSPRQSTRNVRQGTGSDSDDTSEGSNPSLNNSTPQTNNTPNAAASVVVGNATSNNMPIGGMNNVGNPDNGLLPSGRPRKYNFLTELDPSLDGNQRISVLQQRMTDIRKTYNTVKAELAAIERRRKKLKRREREAQKAAKAEMQQACS